MSGERYWIRLPDLSEVPLEGTFKPSTILPVQFSRNLKRARGCTRIRDLSDRLPTPAARILNGEVDLSELYPGQGEEALSLYLAELSADLLAATHISRERRIWVELQHAYAVATPLDDDSGRAAVMLDLLTLHVPDPRTPGIYYW